MHHCCLSSLLLQIRAGRDGERALYLYYENKQDKSATLEAFLWLGYLQRGLFFHYRAWVRSFTKAGYLRPNSTVCHTLFLCVCLRVSVRTCMPLRVCERVWIRACACLCGCQWEGVPMCDWLLNDLHTYMNHIQHSIFMFFNNFIRSHTSQISNITKTIHFYLFSQYLQMKVHINVSSHQSTQSRTWIKHCTVFDQQLLTIKLTNLQYKYLYLIWAFNNKPVSHYLG